jgi:Tfp pilus assembly protein PilO
MTIDWRPWRVLLPIWLPVVILAVASVVLVVWQTSDRVGRAAQLESEIHQLESEIDRLEGLETLASGERSTVESIQGGFQHLYGTVFGKLDDRLTRIMRAIYAATREAGLSPGGFSYKTDNKDLSGAIRFSISFAVTGEYEQIRRMLAAIQSSPEFLVVEAIAFSGSDEPTSRELAISVRVGTFLSEADPQQLKRLTGGLIKPQDMAPIGHEQGAQPAAEAPQPTEREAGNGHE